MTANWPAQLTKIAAVTASGAVAAGKHSSWNASSGALIATLPPLTTGAVQTALAAGQVVRAKISKSKSDASSNAVTVTCAAGDTFEGGSTTQALTAAGEKLELVAQTVPGTGGPVWVVEDHTVPRDTADLRYAATARPSTVPAAQSLAKVFTSRSSSYNVGPASMTKIRALAAAAFAGTGRFEICAVGTSLTAGTGATAKVGSWPSQFQKLLTARGYPDGGSGLIVGWSNNSGTNDARVTFGTGWTAFSSQYSDVVQGVSASGSMTVADTKPSTIVDLWYFDGNGTTINWTIDGTAQAPIVGGSTNTFKKVRVSGLTSANHTVVITPGSGASGSAPVYILGVSFMNTSGVVVHNIGLGGMTAPNLNYQTYVGLQATALALASNLTLLEIGANDAKPLQANFGTSVQAFLTAIGGGGSALGLIGDPPTGAGGRPTSDTIPVLYGIADTNNLPLIDMSDRLVSWASLDALGLGYDTDGLQVHLTTAGYADMARTIADGLGL